MVLNVLAVACRIDDVITDVWRRVELSERAARLRVEILLVEFTKRVSANGREIKARDSDDEFDEAPPEFLDGCWPVLLDDFAW